MKNERRLFVVLLLLETAVFAWIVLTRRLPRGHDTLALFLQQYLFLAQATQSHSVALWLPNVSHGLITNWAASCQGGLFQNALLMIGGLPAGTSHLPVFYAGLYVDELILLTGIWSLGRRYYARSSTRFFVAAAAIGSSFWMDHLVCNFRVYYCLPLLLSLMHDFLDSGSRWKLFLAGNLAVLQFTGGTPYIPIFTVLIALVYFIVYAFVFRIPPGRLLRSLRPRPADAVLILINVGLLAALYATLSHGASELRLFRPGRNPDGSVPLDEFLTHGGALNPIRYADLFLGLSPSLDYTLYCGIFTVACAALGVILRPGRTVQHLAICLLLVLLFSTGFLGAVSAIAYTLVPPLHFFRYVSLTAPVVRLFLILLSGFGFEALLSRRTALTRGLPALSRGLLAGAVLAALLVGAIIQRPEVLSDATAVLRTGRLGLGQRPGADVRGNALPLLGGSALAMAAVGIMLGLRSRLPAASPWFVAVMLGIHTLDLYGWKVQMTFQETVSLSPEQAAHQDLQPPSYVPRRDPDYERSACYRAWKNDFFKQGSVHDFTDAYLGMDPPTSRFLSIAWMAPMDALLAANAGQPLNRVLTGIPRLQLIPGGPYAKVSGRSVDKIQIFSRAHAAGSDAAVAEALNNPGFRGDVLLLTSGPGGEAVADVLSRNERLSAPCSILHFDFDELVAKVDLGPGEAGGWMMYADVWHPGWTATVNERPVPVERAFLAYKAVKLEPGANVVRFRFRDPVRAACYRLIGAASVFFLIALGVLLVRLFREPRVDSVGLSPASERPC